MVGFRTLTRIAGNNKRRGFTIMEMLIVISIITLLATIGLNGYTQNIRRARDTKRKADLEQIRGSLEMYRADNLGIGYVATPTQYNLANATTFVSLYMNGQVPGDPLTRTNYYYERYNPPITYQLCAHLEVSTSTCTVPGSCCGQMSCGSLGPCNYRVTQP